MVTNSAKGSILLFMGVLDSDNNLDFHGRPVFASKRQKAFRLWKPDTRPLLIMIWTWKRWHTWTCNGSRSSGGTGRSSQNTLYLTRGVCVFEWEFRMIVRLWTLLISRKTQRFLVQSKILCPILYTALLKNLQYTSEPLSFSCIQLLLQSTCSNLLLC